MEAIAAVSLAGDILQFLNFTGDVISKSRQIHHSISGTLKEHDDLEGCTSDLKALSGRLQASAGPLDSVLVQLCSGCCEVADELLVALKRLSVKGKATRSQSLRKALKALWGQEKLRSLERRLAEFRQQLTFHVAVELRSQLDASKVQQSAAFQALDKTTKEGTRKILDILQDNKDHLIATTDAQTLQLRALHTRTETIVNHEFKSAAANLVEQSEATRTLAAKEQERSRTEVLDAISNATSGYGSALSTKAEDISGQIEEANENTRAQITEILDRNQEIMKQEINGLQRGLRQLQLEIDRKAEELKEIIIKINTTREGSDRTLLREMGNSATVVLMSLHELYKALEEMLKPIVQQARIAFGALFGLHIEGSAIEDQSTFELETNLNPEVGISLPMYYAFYYQPLFRNFDPDDPERPGSEIFSSTKINGWIHILCLAPDDPRESSPEARAFFDLARNGNKLVWTMTTLVAGLNACLTPKDAIFILSIAFSVRYDPRCVLPAQGSWSCPPSQLHCNSDFRSACTNHPQSDIPSQVRRFFEEGSQQGKLQRPRYGLDCTIGKRLAEDFILMSHLADKCGLQEEMGRPFAFSSSMRSRIRPPPRMPASRDRADITLALVALTSQTLPWTVKVVDRGEAHFMHRVIFVRNQRRSVLQVEKSTTMVEEFVNFIKRTGIPVSMRYSDPETVNWPDFQERVIPALVENRDLSKRDPLERLDFARYYPHMVDIPKSDRQAWYESVEYNHLLKTVTWFPSAGAYQEWERFRTRGPTQRGVKTLKHRQALPAVLTDPYVRQLKREYGPLMTPSEAFAAPSTEVDVDLDYHNYQAQKACHEAQSPERPGGSAKNMTDVSDGYPRCLVTASIDAGQTACTDQGAIDAEERSARGAAAAGGTSDQELRTSRMIAVQQILEMYNSSAPLSELPADDVTLS